MPRPTPEGSDAPRLCSFWEVLHQVRPKQVRLVGVDGWPGAGKSTLAKALARRLGARWLQVDAFVLRYAGSYREGVDGRALGASMGRGSVIVDGLLLRDILDDLDMTPDLWIWVPPRGEVWIPPDLQAELVEYRFRRQPFADADYVLKHTPQLMDPNQAEVDVAFIRAKTQLSIVIALGGMLALIVGLVVLVWGSDREGVAQIELPGGIKFSASGLGGVIMMTSAVWAYFAYRARPGYATRREVRERRVLDGGASVEGEGPVVERHTVESSTVAHVVEARRDLDTP